MAVSKNTYLKYKKEIVASIQEAGGFHMANSRIIPFLKKKECVKGMLTIR